MMIDKKKNKYVLHLKTDDQQLSRNYNLKVTMNTVILEDLVGIDSSVR
ncbi:MAG: hypothetical protein ACEY3J_01735 [Arsenophonus sp.]